MLKRTGAKALGLGLEEIELKPNGNRRFLGFASEGKQEKQQQIPFGDDNKKSTGEGIQYPLKSLPRESIGEFYEHHPEDEAHRE